MTVLVPAGTLDGVLGAQSTQIRTINTDGREVGTNTGFAGISISESDSVSDPVEL